MNLAYKHGVDTRSRITPPKDVFSPGTIRTSFKPSHWFYLRATPMGQVVEDLPASSGKQTKLLTGIAAAKNIQLIKICFMSDGCAERPVVRESRT